MKMNEWLTIGAIIIGPIVAVLITLWRDGRKENRRQKTAILASLMRTRSVRQSPEHVGALNLIQLEFHGRKSIIGAHEKYIEHLKRPLPPVDAQEHFLQERENLFLQLLTEIASDLKYKFDKKDLERLSYVPPVWQADEGATREFVRLLSKLLSEKRAPDSTQIPQEHNPFPPPPE